MTFDRRPASITGPVVRGLHYPPPGGVQDLDFRTRVRQDSAHFEQTGSDPDYGFIRVFGSGSGFSNFCFWYLPAKQT